MEAENTSNTTVSQADNSPQSVITPELLKQVTEKVLAMLRMDLKLESERYRLTDRSAKLRGGWK